jgi:plastocyanin
MSQDPLENNSINWALRRPPGKAQRRRNTVGIARSCNAARRDGSTARWMSCFRAGPQSLLLLTTLAGALGWAACTRSDPTPPGGAATASSAAAPRSAAGARASSGAIQITVTAEGFVAARTRVKVGQPVTLVVTRKVERTCATEIVLKDYGINKPLPLDQAVAITFTPRQPGRIRYACAMDMLAGELVAE